MERLLQDLRFAVRVLWKAPAFTLMAVATMGLAIGATTSMFSVIEATLIRRLPFQDPQQLMMLYLTRSENGGRPTTSRWAYPRIQILQKTATVFDSIANFGRTTFNVTGIDQPLRINGETASASYFRVVRVQAAVGRTYSPEEDDRPGEHAVAVIGDGLWKRLFGGRPDVLGKTIGINQVSFTIIGVMPSGFRGLSGNAEIWVPNTMAPVIMYPEHLTSLQNFHNVVARLRPGVSYSQALAEMDVRLVFPGIG
jgi:putative ABC transport system permease protein